MDSSELGTFLYKLADDFNGSNVTVELHGKPVVVIQRIEDMQHVMRDNRHNYRKNGAWLRAVLGPSRLSEDGDAWRKRFDLTHGPLVDFDHATATQVCEREALRSIEMLKTSSENGRTRIPGNELHELFSRIVLQVFVGVQPYQLTLDDEALLELFEKAAEVAYVPRGGASQVDPAVTGSIVELKRRIRRSFASVRHLPEPRSPLLAAWLEAEVQPDKPVYFEHELAALLLAGAGPPSHALGWCLYLLAQNPELQSRLRELCLSFWSDIGPARDWRRLSELRQFVSESLRIFPPNPMQSVIALDHDSVQGARIDPDQLVMISLVGVNHDRRFRPSPWEIVMDRAAQPTGATTAFGIGPRMCGAKSFSLMALTVILASFLREASFKLSSDAAPDFFWHVFLAHRGGQPIIVTGGQVTGLNQCRRSHGVSPHPSLPCPHE